MTMYRYIASHSRRLYSAYFRKWLSISVLQWLGSHCLEGKLSIMPW